MCGGGIGEGVLKALGRGNGFELGIAVCGYVREEVSWLRDTISAVSRGHVVLVPETDSGIESNFSLTGEVWLHLLDGASPSCR